MNNLLPNLELSFLLKNILIEDICQYIFYLYFQYRCSKDSSIKTYFGLQTSIFHIYDDEYILAYRDNILQHIILPTKKMIALNNIKFIGHRRCISSASRCYNTKFYSINQIMEDVKNIKSQFQWTYGDYIYFIIL